MKYPIEVLIAKIKFEISLLELENRFYEFRTYQRDLIVWNQILEILENEKEKQ